MNYAVFTCPTSKLAALKKQKLYVVIAVYVYILGATSNTVTLALFANTLKEFIASYINKKVKQCCGNKYVTFDAIYDSAYSHVCIIKIAVNQ